MLIFYHYKMPNFDDFSLMEHKLRVVKFSHNIEVYNNPPCRVITCPVSKSPPSSAKNSAHLAISIGFPILISGVSYFNISIVSSLYIT